MTDSKKNTLNSNRKMSKSYSDLPFSVFPTFDNYRRDKTNSYSPEPVKNAYHFLPKSQEYLVNNFYKEFWPIAKIQLKKTVENEVKEIIENDELDYTQH